jgi:hypothetical protein
MTGQLSLLRPLRTRTELYLLCQVLWNRTIPSKQVCPEHDAPFDAFATGVLRRGADQIVIHWPPEGLGGKCSHAAVHTWG